MKNDIGLGFKIRLGRGFKTDAERAAVAIRADMRLPPYERLSAVLLAKRLGLHIIYPHDIPGFDEILLTELETQGSDRWSAAYIPTPAPHPDLIINNSKHSLERQEANIFHEIAHQICSHEPDGIEIINGLPIREFSKDKEDQANFLGQALHISKEAVFRVLKNGLTREAICEMFCASRQLVDLRINITGATKIMARSQARWGR